MKKKFSQGSSTTQATKREREMGDVTDDDKMRLREDLQFARALHTLAEKEVGALRAKCAAYAEENAHLRALLHLRPTRRMSCAPESPSA